jgi:hypothetical protein
VPIKDNILGKTANFSIWSFHIEIDDSALYWIFSDEIDYT